MIGFVAYCKAGDKSFITVHKKWYVEVRFLKKKKDGQLCGYEKNSFRPIQQ